MSDHGEVEGAKAVLDSVQASEERLSNQMLWPFWRHAAVGGLIAALMVGQALGHTVSIMTSAAAILGVLAIKHSDKRRHGMFVSGLRKGPTAWVTGLSMLLAVAGVVIVRTGIPAPQTAQPIFWVLVFAIAAATTALSYLWQYIYRNELRGGAR